MDQPLPDAPAPAEETYDAADWEAAAEALFGVRSEIVRGAFVDAGLSGPIPRSQAQKAVKAFLKKEI